jgi:FKBP-type peptidyl-prolyl cis-trans isomerase 2
MKYSYLIITIIFLLGAVFMTGCNATPGEGEAKNGDIVKVNYTGKLEDGTIFDSSEGRAPLEFTLGAGQMIPGFEKAVLGMKVGETKTVTIPSKEAYGQRHDELVMEIPREELPPDLNPQVGLQLQSTRSDGAIVVVTIIEVADTTITVDANHPLAGKDLIFEIKLVSIS